MISGRVSSAPRREPAKRQKGLVCPGPTFCLCTSPTQRARSITGTAARGIRIAQPRARVSDTASVTGDHASHCKTDVLLLCYNQPFHEMSGRIFEVDAETEPKQPQAPLPPPPPKRKSTRRTLLWIGIGLLAVAVLVGGSFSIWTLRTHLKSAIANTPAPSPSPSPGAAGKTKFETFTAKYGRVLIRGGTLSGTVTGTGSVAVEAVQMIDASTKEKTEAIVFHLMPSGYFRTPAVAVIDYDEIDSLLVGLDYIAKADASITPLKTFQAVYKSRSGFQVGSFSDEKGKISAGLASGEIAAASVYLKREDLSKLREQIVVAKAKLDAVR